MNRVLLANAIGRKPASSQYRELLSSAFKYGLTEGTEKSDNISLTELGVSVTKPRDGEERGMAIKRATLQPDLFRRIYNHYSNGKLPQGTFFLSVLERDFGVPRERCQECANILVQNGQFAGILRELQGALYVIFDGEAAAEEQDFIPPDTAVPVDEALPLSLQPQVPTERFIFLGHGKNRRPLEQLKKVLDQFKIAYKVAVDEPQLARPIPVKVAQTMRECHSAILIFTADEEFQRADGTTIWRPSENVIYELGASSVLYDNRIVIFREEGVEFPANFDSIGRIPFERDRLDAKGLDLVKELVGLGLIRVQAA
jgi:hypothetical protein